ncbi:MAG: flagellar basal body rod C-terminal domain-containing protein [Humidesulfovibrio sp.]|nr:flagellar basal body rod C-terminal domain-containing protein [Humidesulfovibrio sp.]
MSDGISASVQALGALDVSLQATANNIANVSTEGFRSARADFSDGPGGQGVQVASISRADSSGVDLPREMVGLMQVDQAYTANASMIRTADETTGTVLNMIA